MAEYMDYNDYGDGPKSKGAKIRHKLVLIGSVLWLVAVVVWVIVGNTSREVFRSKFDTKSTKTYLIGTVSEGENEFYSLYTQLQNEDISRKELNKNYNTLYKWFKKPPKKFPTNSKPRKVDAGGYLAVYLPYVLEGNATQFPDSAMTKGYLGVDVIMLPYESDVSGDITISAPIRFSAKYDCASGITTFYEPPSERFRLNFFNFSVGFDKNTKADCSVALSYSLTKTESENQKVQKNILLDDEGAKTVSGGGVSETAISCSFPNEGKKLVVKFDDLMYRKLSQITIRAKDAKKYKISIN